MVLVFGRLVPALRTVVALPAGMARMRLVPFVLWTLLGSLIWTSLLTLAGYLLESQYERIAQVAEPGVHRHLRRSSWCGTWCAWCGTGRTATEAAAD